MPTVGIYFNEREYGLVLNYIRTRGWDDKHISSILRAIILMHIRAGLDSVDLRNRLKEMLTMRYKELKESEDLDETLIIIDKRIYGAFIPEVLEEFKNSIDDNYIFLIISETKDTIQAVIRRL